MAKVLIQGIHFDSYEMIEKGNKVTECLCNVTPETFEGVVQGQYVRIDFDGDGQATWGVIITKKDYKNSRIYYSII